MKTLLILLLVSGCSSVPLRERLIKTHRVDTVQIGHKCPNDSYYSFNTGLCHYSKPLEPIKPIIKAKPRKKLKKPVIDCVKVINQCMGGR